MYDFHGDTTANVMQSTTRRWELTEAHAAGLSRAGNPFQPFTLVLKGSRTPGERNESCNNSKGLLKVCLRSRWVTLLIF